MTVGERLTAAGMSQAESLAKQALFARIEAALPAESAFERHRFWVPGRIEVLGKHTDYAGGRSLLCTVERGFCVAASARDDGLVRVVEAMTGDVVSARTEALDVPVPGHWSNYVMTVVERLARDFAPLRGADIAFASDLPIAAGVSSSSALVTSLALALMAVNEVKHRPAYRMVLADDDALAGYLGAVENGLPFGDLPGARGVGTFGGSEDHTAILRSRVDSLVQYRFCPVQFERVVALPPHHGFLIASSGIVAEKTGSALAAYNRLSMLSRAALDRWNADMSRHDGSLGEAAALYGVDLPRHLRAGSAELGERAEQFLIESERIVPAAGDALADHDVQRFGELVDESMRNAERMLHNQVPETVFLARRARELGAVAASAFGAGFGGSV
ncbi:MAG TPA: galactokinase family protein, partial [Gemmatimonadaceae bacterium]|nr:galactokinase family protein [Gemmatimonadaceae bacterium]